MLTDLSFLTPGRTWPPPTEQERMDGYAANRAMFEADHGGAFREAFARLERRIGECGLPESLRCELVINYPKLISVSTAGLLFGAPVGIVAGKESDAVSMQAAADIAERSMLTDTLTACAIDVSRYGDGLLLVHRGDDGKGVIDLSRPDVWYPVVDAANVRRTLYHVLATPYRVAPVTSADNHPDRLQVQVHERGRVTLSEYRLVGSCLGDMLSSQVQATGLDDFAVIPVHNLRTSDRVHGIDDYNDIQSMVCELDIRLAQIARVLDRHTDPTMQGPEEALTKGKDGVKRFVPGGFFVNKESGLDGQYSGNVSYLTWDAQLTANFELCKLLIEQIRVTSEMGALLCDMSDKMGQVPSGSALRRLLTAALKKIARLRQSFEPCIIRALRLCSELGGASLRDVPVTLRWDDGLPGDPTEDANIASLRTSGKATMSRKRALMQLDGLSEADAEDELASIEQEEAASLPPDGAGLDETDDEPAEKE